MTQAEYKEAYQRLADVFPNKFGSHVKMETIWNYVKDLDLPWFKSLVDRVIMTTHGDLDIGEIVAGERRSRKSKEFAEAICQATQAWGEVTDKGLENVLGKYKSNNLSEAVEKSRAGKL